jgi:hypothetical protein
VDENGSIVLHTPSAKTTKKGGQRWTLALATNVIQLAERRAQKIAALEAKEYSLAEELMKTSDRLAELAELTLDKTPPSAA